MTIIQKKQQKGRSQRLPFLDMIRGLTLLSMILYHASWDAVYLVGADWSWYVSEKGFLWQQSICWTFILLSGFCIPFSRRLWRRGLTVFGAGALVTLVTVLVLPEDRVVFGVLTLLGSCMLLMIPLRLIFERDASSKIRTAIVGLVISAALFAFFRRVNSGIVGFSFPANLLPGFSPARITVPVSFYRNLLTAYLGFPFRGFYSTDYFPLLPWGFLYLCGYFFCLLCKTMGWLAKPLFQLNCRPLSWIGRHSLLIYLLHQPVLYAFVLIYMQSRR